ncbi:hypothetical protein [Methylobacterium gossipiicola]|uniref:Uncharacterized protein n=1 Tax=Methylobacterium gossipiicola TaxID=582675 RepID=A0A1I2QJ11_9HYPH|nr:hypothetical protein [Methylobacterium gossipiicola]SFG27319.1 hypothetical protein SAMN05192565_101118 [Methylobacterium gossipiicola]
MSIAIDPSEMRTPTRVPVKTGASSRAGRLAVLTVLGGVGLVGLSAGAYSMLSGLAGPTPSGVRIGHVSADWPDLRDGVPALVSTAGRTDLVPSTANEPISVRTIVSEPTVAPEGAAPQAKPFEARSNEVTPVEASAPEAKPLEAIPVEAKAVDVPRPAEAAKLASITPAAKPARLPVIENAAPVPPAPMAPLVEKARPAPLVAPTARETTRARTAPDNTFAALPPASATPASTAKPKPAAVAHAKPPMAKPTAKPAAETAKVASAQPAQAAEPEGEDTEVFGVKVPSLAPVGRKLVEGVEALGDAVKRFPEQF